MASDLYDAAWPLQRTAVPHPKAKGNHPFRQVRRLPVEAGCIHLGVIKELVPVLRELRADPGSIVREAELDPRLFDDPDNVISSLQLNALLTLSVKRARCPHVGLLVGQKATITSMGIVGCLMQHSRTVGSALESFVHHLHLQNRIAAPKLEVSDGHGVLSLGVYAPIAANAHQIADMSLAVAYQALSAICGPGWRPTEVLLPRDRPAYPQVYRAFFRAPLRFNEESAALVFPAHWLDAPIAGADEVFRQIFEERIAELEAVPNGEFQDDVRRALRSRLLKNKCSAHEIAGHFAIHRRTLHRRLMAEGTDFSAIADEMRFEIARQLLAATSITLGQVAAALGYSEAAAFTRAFRRWSGQTPKSWRVEHRHAASE